MSSDRDYDLVRRQLLERGYLDGRIERFVLRDLTRSDSGAGMLVRSSVKAALLGGPLLGALTAGAAAAANRPLLSWFDLPVLWLYFSLPAAIALFLLDLSAAGMTTALARSRGVRGGDAWKPAVFVGVPVLAYLWWVWGRGRPEGSIVEDLVFLGAALAVSLTISWLAGLVSLAAAIRGSGQVPERGRRRALLLLGVLLPVAGLLLALQGLGWGRADAGPSVAAFEPVAGGGRLLWLGIDGLGPELLEAVGPEDGIGTLHRLASTGATFPLKRSEKRDPAVVWTTRLTGALPEVHGVHSLDAERLPGVATPLSSGAGPPSLVAALRWVLPSKTVPASGGSRRVRDLPEIVALRAPSASVGWWASWPATAGLEAEARGYVVSDRVLPKLLTGAEQDRDTAPTSLFEKLRREYPERQELLERGFAETFADIEDAAIRDLLWESFLIDGFNSQVAGQLLDDPDLRAAFVYLPGLDILRTRLATAAGAETGARWLQARSGLTAYLAWLDRQVGGLVERPGVAQVLVVADPGRGSSLEDDGSVWIHGIHATDSCSGPPVTDIDLAPMSLGLLGFPASDEMDGSVPGRCTRGLPETGFRISSYGRRNTAELGRGSAYDPEMVERLKSLGYLK